MQLDITRESLLIPLQKVIGAVERKPTMPILNNVLLVAENGLLTITATDLEIELVAKQQTDIIENGALTIPARKLYEICKNLPDGAQINLKSNDNNVSLNSSKSSFKLFSLAANQFPSLDDITSLNKFSLPQSLLRKIIEKTHFAMAQQDIRYYLNGLLLELNRDYIRAVTADGHRMAIAQAAVALDINNTQQFIVPRKAISELLKLLADSDESIEVGFSNNHLQIDFGDSLFTSKLIDGKFPDYQNATPQNYDKRVTIDKEQFKLALTRSSILSNEKFKGVGIYIADDLLTIKTRNPEQEEAREELSIAYRDAKLEIGFNVSYMLDVINVLSNKELSLDLKDADSSILVSETTEIVSKYIIMPMRL